MKYEGLVELPQNLKVLPEQSKRCPHCRREIFRTWHYCPSCGKRTNESEVTRITMNDAENASFILNGLVNYHERAVGFNSNDRFVAALRYALLLVESLFEQEKGDTV